MRITVDETMRCVPEKKLRVEGCVVCGESGDQIVVGSEEMMGGRDQEYLEG